MRALTRSSLIAALAFLTASFTLAACQSTSESTTSQVTVEGNVTVRGNEPFAAYVMETDQSNYYVLVFPDGVSPNSPATMRVTGRVYTAYWDSRPFAHLEVATFESVP